MRVTQNIIYSTQVGSMNSALNKLYASSIQSGSGLRINKPSDDPLGAGRAIQSRATLSQMSLYEENISTATGWLSSYDAILSGEGSIVTLLTRLTELAEQGATGTYTAENRKEISMELRQIYEQLITLSNSSYAGQYIFSGHKTDARAYAAALGVSVKDTGAGLDGMYFETEGDASYTVIIQATSSGAAETASYRYSEDGGNTWMDIASSDITVNYPETGRVRITAGGASVIMDAGAVVNAADTADSSSADNGTWIYLRPTAIYQGDDNDTQAAILYGSGTNTGASASGCFGEDVTVRIDGNDGVTLTYSYSADNGASWTQGKTAVASPVKIFAPGGYLELANAPAAGEQYIIHPHRAEVALAISDTSDITLNLIGKNVFGGVYRNPATGKKETVEKDGNLFETVGNLIAAAETNDQQGMANALAQLASARSVVLTNAAIVGGRENRLTLTSSALELRKLVETDRLSSIEDVDMTELLTRIAQQQTAYSAVLQSSSIIMRQSLLDYL
ncbi:MAG: flagellar biosynthesis protein FlgL [Deltaproteobacteria bacterium]|nr:flagellar biosynthesis protein FlgL [Deltaproteobacteria bacterium]